MTKTRAVKWWVFRHKMYHLYYSCKYGHWKGVWSILSTPWWIDFKAVDPGPDDFRGIPYRED